MLWHKRCPGLLTQSNKLITFTRHQSSSPSALGYPLFCSCLFIFIRSSLRQFWNQFCSIRSEVNYAIWPRTAANGIGDSLQQRKETKVTAERKLIHPLPCSLEGMSPWYHNTGAYRARYLLDTVRHRCLLLQYKCGKDRKFSRLNLENYMRVFPTLGTTVLLVCCHSLLFLARQLPGVPGC